MSFDRQRVLRAYEQVRDDLLAERGGETHWTGELSASALSTATALSALAVARPEWLASGDRSLEHHDLVARGVRWLLSAQNADGGWGDTDKSFSNIATTMLVVAALRLTRSTEFDSRAIERAEQYIAVAGGVAGVRRRYGIDKTFAVPILANAALAGMVDWRDVPPLPFELACFPQSWFRLLRLPVVSYAIPALVAIGQARFHHAPPASGVVRFARGAAIQRSLEVLERMQPASGGYLEATPLTSFVVMSLASIGRTSHPVCRRGIEFLLHSVRSDGSWPIDTNLATWLTSLTIQALSGSPEATAGCLDWLLGCQHQQTHAFTAAEPGGWAWTDLSGGVPDADDTSAALLALATLCPAGREDDRVASAARAGVLWLLQLQNRDGGWPTFCRGWGKLPFDRSGTDLTAHALRALSVWQPRLTSHCETAESHQQSGLGRKMRWARERGLAFLAARQQDDGSWFPLWFGDQWHPGEENPVYGTGRVLLAYRDLERIDERPARRGLAWLVAHQHADGGWGETGYPAGAGSDWLQVMPASASVEQTSVAVEALLAGEHDPNVQVALSKGVNWLVDAVDRGRHRETTPIGFYFAKLWYYERLYPLIFAASALGKAAGLVPAAGSVRARIGEQPATMPG